jgi:carboxypeptidase T
MGKTKRFFIIAPMIGMLALAGVLFSTNFHFASASNQISSDSLSQVSQSQAVVIRIYYNTQQQLNAVAGELDIWEVHPTTEIGTGPGYVVAAVSLGQQSWLQSLGYRIELDLEKTSLIQAPAAALDPRYYYFDDFVYNSNGLYMVDFLQETTTAYPEITELLDIGNAWGADHGLHPRDIWIMRITNEDPQYDDITDKPTFFLFANIHAREDTTPEMAIRYIKYLTEGYLDQGGYGIDPDVTWLVNHHVAYVMVSMNPDGHELNEIDTSLGYWGWRKNVDNDDGCSDSSTWGVDLNRNSSFYWALGEGSSGSPCSDTYRGPSAASEPETIAFQEFATGIFTDWNGDNANNQIVPSPDNASGIFITLHSYADDVLWPFGFSPGAAPNNAQLRTIGRKLADITGTLVPTGYVGYATDGTSDDWVYGHFGIAAFTYEIGPDYGICGGFHPSYDCQDGTGSASRNFWAEMSPSFIYANKIAATPYITAYGPDAINLAVNPISVPGGQPVDLSASLIDQRYLSDLLEPIMAAEYFLDAPGADGTGISMSPVDGTWGETSEDAHATLKTTGLSVGRHYVLVHGKNEAGVWGPFTAVFLEITAAEPGAEFSTNSPVLLGNQMIFTNTGTGSGPITYAWDFGDEAGISTEINPSYTYTQTGSYTVTLVATNMLGTDGISHTVTVEPRAITGIAFSQENTGMIFAGDAVHFLLDLSPDAAAILFEYTLNFGDGTVISGTSDMEPMDFFHIYSRPGVYTVQAGVKNDTMLNPLTDTLVVYVNYKFFLPLATK